jgi:hypothetical protein
MIQDPGQKSYLVWCCYFVRNALSATKSHCVFSSTGPFYFSLEMLMAEATYSLATVCSLKLWFLAKCQWWLQTWPVLCVHCRLLWESANTHSQSFCWCSSHVVELVSTLQASFSLFSWVYRKIFGPCSVSTYSPQVVAHYSVAYTSAKCHWYCIVVYLFLCVLLQ